MFFKKKKEKKSKLDKIVMGVIIGGAVGSVIGISQNKKARKFVKMQGDKIVKQGKTYLKEREKQIKQDKKNQE